MMLISSTESEAREADGAIDFAVGEAGGACEAGEADRAGRAGRDEIGDGDSI